MVFLFKCCTFRNKLLDLVKETIMKIYKILFLPPLKIVIVTICYRCDQFANRVLAI